MGQRYGLTNPDELARAVRDLAAASGSYPILSNRMTDPHIAGPSEQFRAQSEPPPR